MAQIITAVRALSDNYMYLIVDPTTKQVPDSGPTCTDSDTHVPMVDGPHVLMVHPHVPDGGP